MNTNWLRAELIALICVVSMVLAGCEQAAETAGPPGGARPPVVVQVSIVQEQFVVDEIEAIGTLEANESVVVSAAVTDNVASIYFDDGQQVAAGDILVTLTNDEQTAELAEAQANLDDAQRQLQRLEGIGNQLASKSEIDAARALTEANRGRLEAIKARLSDRIITAPFAGVLGFRRVSIGALVTPGTEITRLDDISLLNLDFSVPEIFLGQLANGNLVTGTSPAWPGREFNGRVTSVDSRVDPATRAVRVRAEIPNGDHHLLPGMLINVTLFSDQYSAVVVEESALVQAGNKSSVFVINDDLIAEQRPVVLGKRLPGHVVIEEGLSVGERVVVDGTLTLRPGAKVRVLGEEPAALIGKSDSTSSVRS